MTLLKSRKFNIGTKLILSISLLVLIVIAVISVIIGFQAESIIREEAESLAKETAYRYGIFAKAVLETGLNETRALAMVFESSANLVGFSLSRRQSNKILEYVIDNSPGFFGIFVAFEPNAFDGKDANFIDEWGHDSTGRFIPYWSRDQNGKPTFRALIDYDKVGPGDYYQLPKSTRIECVLDPFIHTGWEKEQLIATLVSPINNINGEFIGVVGIDLDLEELGLLVEEIQIAGYRAAYIDFYSSDGTVAGSKIKNDIGKNIVETQAGEEFADLVLKNRPFLVERSSDVTEGIVISYGAPVQIGRTGTAWMCVVNIPKDEFLAKIKQLLMAIVIVGLVAIVLMMVIVFFLARTISLPVRAAAEAIDQIADGDLDVDVSTGRKDEIGRMQISFGRLVDSLKYKETLVREIAAGAGDFTVKVKLASEKDEFGRTIQRMIGSLNRILGQVNKAVKQVSSGADQISTSSQSLSQGATEQAGSLEEISASLAEINSQSRQNAENAMEASSLAKKAVENADNGNSRMKELVSSMERINTSSDQIKKVVNVIDDIAFQINLLALNANVEAARAGKYGKGFAVVADEVRNLAVRSADAVKETTVMVEETIKNIEQGNMAAGATAKQLSEIVSGSSRVADFLEEIAQASKEQAVGIEQINDSLEQIEKVTQINSANAEESAAASEELASQSQHLRALIAKFKLEEEVLDREEVPEGISQELIKRLVQRELIKIQEGKSVKQLVEKTTDDLEEDTAMFTDSPIDPKQVIDLEDDNFGSF